MSYTNENWRVAVTKLLELTSRNEIKWELSELFKGDAWTIVDSSFEAKMADKAYVISKTRSRYYLDENDFVWQGGFSLTVFERTGFDIYEQIATAPTLSSLGGLYDAAENNIAFNRDALGGLLS